MKFGNGRDPPTMTIISTHRSFSDVLQQRKIQNFPSNLKWSQETPVYRGDLRFSTMFDGNANDTVDYQFYIVAAGRAREYRVRHQPGRGLHVGRIYRRRLDLDQHLVGGPRQRSPLDRWRQRSGIVGLGQQPNATRFDGDRRGIRFLGRRHHGYFRVRVLTPEATAITPSAACRKHASPCRASAPASRVLQSRRARICRWYS